MKKPPISEAFQSGAPFFFYVGSLCLSRVLKTLFVSRIKDYSQLEVKFYFPIVQSVYQLQKNFRC